jgi:O-antigen ligase
MDIRTSLGRFQSWFLLFLIAAIPVSLKYLTKEPFAISWLNVLSVIFIFLGGLNVVIGAVPLKFPKHRAFIILVVCFLLAMVWALYNTPSLRQGIGLWTSRLGQPLLVGFFAYQLLEARFLTPKQIVGAVFASLIPLILFGAFQLAGITEYRDPGRITATYFYPNTFARYMDIILLLSLPWILFGLKKGKRIALGVWGIGVIMLLLSKSYNGTVSLVAGLIAFVVCLPAVYKQWKTLFLVGVAVATVLVALNAPSLPKWQTSITDSRLTRLEFWNIATQVIADNFWTGIGIKTWELNYPKLVEQYGPFPPRNWGSVQPHNVFLDSFIKGGLPAFFAITALLVWPIVEGFAVFRSRYKKSPYWWVGGAVMAYGVAMFTFGLIDDPIWSDDTMPLLFIVYFTLAYITERSVIRSRSE